MSEDAAAALERLLQGAEQRLRVGEVATACDNLLQAAAVAQRAQLPSGHARACELLGEAGLRSQDDAMAHKMLELAHGAYLDEGDAGAALRVQAALSYLEGPRRFADDGDALSAELQLVEELAHGLRRDGADDAAVRLRRLVLDRRYQEDDLRGPQLSLPLAAGRLGLTAADRALLMAACAPALDDRLARLLRETQGDLLARAPSRGFLQRLVAPGLAVTAAALAVHFEDDAPLLRRQLITLHEHPDRPRGARVHALCDADPDVCDFLQGQRTLSRALSDHAALLGAPPAYVESPLTQGPQMAQLIRRLQGGAVSRVIIIGDAGSGKKALAAWLAERLSPARRVLAADLTALVPPQPALDQELLLRTVRRLLREALLHDAVPLLDLGDGPGEGAGPSALWRRLSPLLHRHGVDAAQPVVLCARSAAPVAALFTDSAVELHLPPLNLDQQAAHFTRALRRAGVEPPAEALLRAGVCQAGLLPGAIVQSAERAAAMARLAETEGAVPVRPTLDHLREAVRGQTAGSLSRIAQRIVSPFRMDDLIVPQEGHDQLCELIAYVRNQSQVFDAWGFGRKVPYGRSVTALFTGPPGTGKTMAASVVAAELGLDLFRIDLSQVVSKYIGETEKNLAQLFDAASEGQAVLLFDEADALFGKRTEVKSSVDRYSNLEINFLLQRIEAFSGVAILTSNLLKNIDEAFRRRLRFLVEFPFPGEEERLWLWQSMLPPEAEIRGEVPFAVLAGFELSGGNIKSAILRAAFAAAARGDAILPYDMVRAALVELDKMGKLSRDLSHLFDGLELPPDVA